MGEQGVVLRGVSVRFGATTALSGISLSLGRGLHVLLGPNGSGKTTLLRVIGGLLRPSSGEVLVNGVDPARALLRGKGLVGGVIGEEDPPFWMTAREYLRYSAWIAGCDGECLSRIYAFARSLGLHEFLNKPVTALSSGTKKKLVVLSALTSRAPILVVDEPFSALDVESVSRVARILAGEARERTVIVATHIMPPALGRPASVIVLVGGKLAVHASLETVASIDKPIIKVKLKNSDCITIERVRSIGSTRIEITGGEAWALVDGPSYEKCREAGLCSDTYTIDISHVLWAHRGSRPDSSTARTGSLP